MYYEQIIRGQIANERIERIADACSKTSPRRRARRRLRLHLPLQAGLGQADAYPELQA